MYSALRGHDASMMEPLVDVNVNDNVVTLPSGESVAFPLVVCNLQHLDVRLHRVTVEDWDQTTIKQQQQQRLKIFKLRGKTKKQQQ